MKSSVIHCWIHCWMQSWMQSFLTVTVIACSITAIAPAQVLSAPQVSEETNLAIATDAQNKYDEAMALVITDPEKARELFRESAAKFQQIVNSGISNGELFFNLGNALVQSDDVGRAVGAYLEAERLLPTDARIAANLTHARSLVADRRTTSVEITPLDRVASFWTWLAYPTRIWTALIAWTMVWGIVVAGILSGWISRVPWRPLLIGTSAVCLALSVTVGVDAVRRQINPPGVLVTDQVIVRKGNGEGFAPAFTETLSRGAEFTMIEERPGWYRIRLTDGQSGWVKTSEALVAGQLARTSG